MKMTMTAETGTGGTGLATEAGRFLLKRGESLPSAPAARGEEGEAAAAGDEARLSFFRSVLGERLAREAAGSAEEEPEEAAEGSCPDSWRRGQVSRRRGKHTAQEKRAKCEDRTNGTPSKNKREKWTQEEEA